MVDKEGVTIAAAGMWYPAQSTASGRRAAYMPDAGQVTAAFARIHHLPAFVFEHLRYVSTHATTAAPVNSHLPGFPVLLYLEGATGFRQMSTFQIEDLASHGYIVVAIDQPGAAATVCSRTAIKPLGSTWLSSRPRSARATCRAWALCHATAPPSRPA